MTRLKDIAKRICIGQNSMIKKHDLNREIINQNSMTKRKYSNKNIANLGVVWLKEYDHLKKYLAKRV